jgi:hypothetical protein
MESLIHLILAQSVDLHPLAPAGNPGNDTNTRARDAESGSEEPYQLFVGRPVHGRGMKTNLDRVSNLTGQLGSPAPGLGVHE